MRALRAACLLVAASAGLTGPARAQIPYVQAYFSLNPPVTESYCPGPGLQDLYIVAHNLNALIVATEFSVRLPPELAYLGCYSSALLQIGDPVLAVHGAAAPGVAFAWNRPQVAIEPFLLAVVQTIWVCDSCLNTSAVTVEPHGVTQSLAVVKWPGMTAMPLIGLDSYICVFYAVETTSWGAVKALYGQGGP